jgi:hypothetical protein
MTNAPSKAGMRRWFAENVGRTVVTEQIRPDGRTWTPGPRTIERQGRTKFALDGSVWIEPDANAEVTALTDREVTVVARFSDGRIWHATTYRLTDDDTRGLTS